MSPTSIVIPETVPAGAARVLYAECNQARLEIKGIADGVGKLRRAAAPSPTVDSEVVSNVTLAYRALEEASMRLGKALQALDGGVSVYDKATTVGA